MHSIPDERRDAWLLMFTSLLWRGQNPHEASKLADDGLVEFDRRFPEAAMIVHRLEPTGVAFEPSPALRGAIRRARLDGLGPLLAVPAIPLAIMAVIWILKHLGA